MLLIPIAVLVVPCLLALLERRIVADPVVARTPVVRRGADPAPVAPVVPLHAGPTIDGDTLPLHRAS